MATQTTIELQPFTEPPPPAPKNQFPTIAESPGHTLTTTAPAQTTNSETTTPKLPPSLAILTILQLSSINFLSSFSNGLLAIGLPTIASDLSIPDNLLLWPNSVFYLISGSCLLIAGSVADVLGPRRVFLPGCLLVGAFMLSCGFVQDGIGLIMMRACQGIATAMVLPSAVSIVSRRVEDGGPRNIGFAAIFLAMPLGFAVGLVLGGVFVSGVGWRVGYYVFGGLGISVFGVGCWTLPRDETIWSWAVVFGKMGKEIDWVGAAIASAAFAMLSYVLALLSANTANIETATGIALLVISVVLVPAFVFWMHFQEKRGKPALIPNSIWKDGPFTSVCLMIMLSNSVNSCLEIFSSLFFQEVQHNTAVQAGLKVLPQVLVGAALNILVGTFVNKTPIMLAVLAGNVLQAGSPLLMATINPSWPYWYSAFFAQVLAPLSVDILYTVGTIVVSNAFPEKTQALAGAVFNTFAQLGTSVGLCLMSVISESVTKGSVFEDKESAEALMKGYRAAFWAMFAMMGVACVVGAVGLRKVGKVGVKRD